MQQAWGESSQAGSGGQSPMLAGTPRAAGIINAGKRRGCGRPGLAASTYPPSSPAPPLELPAPKSSFDSARARGIPVVPAGWRSAPTKLARRSASAGGEPPLAAAGGAALSRQGTGGGAEWSQAAADAESAAAAAGSLASFSQQPFAQQLQRPGAAGGPGLYRTSAAGGPPQLERASDSMPGGRLFRPLSSHSLVPSEGASVSGGWCFP